MEQFAAGFGSYERLCSLAETANSTVFLIRQQKRLYVEKIIEKASMNYEGYKELIHLRHPNIADVYQVLENEREVYVFQQYISGRTLAEMLLQKGLFSMEEMLDYTIQICDAIAFLHKQNPPLIHRDIKPSNIMYTEHKEIKLVDLGTIRSFKDHAPKDTVCLGTPEYAAPEQFGYAQTDNRSDIYAIGILCYQFLTGKEIIKGRSLAEQIAENRETIPKIFSRVLLRCCAFDPKNRFASMPQLLMELRRIQLIYKRKGGTLWGRILYATPGFRTDTLWKQIIAVFGYLLMALWFLLMITTPGHNSIAIFNRYFVPLIFWALATNFLDVWQYIPFFQKNIGTRILLIILFFVCDILISAWSLLL